jgi:uncharacterized membrane protein
MGVLAYLLYGILLFVVGTSIYDKIIYGDELLGLSITGGLVTIYLIIFYFDYRKNKKNKTGLFTERKK